jgi:hypothetical protein
MYHFVFEKPKNKSTAASTQSSEERRREELQVSDARSHAAKIAYLKKTAAARKGDQRQTHHDCTEQLERERLEAFALWGEEARERSFLEDNVRRQGSAEDEAVLATTRKKKPATRAEHENDKSKRKPQNPAIFTTKKGNRVYSRTKFKLETPQSLLSETPKDPFDAFPERRLPADVEKVVQYGELADVAFVGRLVLGLMPCPFLTEVLISCVLAFDRIWPEMLCSVRGQTLAVAKSEWKGHGLQDELLFHVQVALACGLNLALQQVPKVSESLALARLWHYSKAIRLLKDRIENLRSRGEMASEDLMMSMLILGVNADVEDALPEVHPLSPLATSQYMHLYGRLSLMPSYATALHRLVEENGGIFRLKHLALADWLLL